VTVKGRRMRTDGRIESGKEMSGETVLSYLRHYLKGELKVL
jgi:hypothetical protein